MTDKGWLPEVLEVGGARRADAPSIIGTAQGETSRRPEAGVGQPSLPTVALDLAAALVYAVDHDLRRTVYQRRGDRAQEQLWPEGSRLDPEDRATP